MSNRTTNIVAVSLLLFAFFSAFFSMRGDSATMDELAHIPAGYSYLTQLDYRLNPEHPPLVKDLAAFPLLFLNLNFPKNSPFWTEGINEQWRFGWEFLYNSGNNPDQIVFWARFPMLLLFIFLGWFIFKWTKELGGNKPALLVLTLFSFSPNFLAHGRLVTTDVGAALGVVMATYFWLKFLREPSKKNIIMAGLIFGIALLLKFSLILLLPFFSVITIIYAFLNKRNLLKYISFAVLAGIIAVVFIVLPVYQLHIVNYPVEKQLSDTKYTLESSPLVHLKELDIWLADKPVIRGLGQYLLGLLMATQRTAAGNTVYFLDMISAAGWWYYFPVVYILKEPLALHILTLISLFLTLLFIKKPFWIETFKRLKIWLQNHFAEFSMLVFLVIYWFASISGNLNIGVRHILPTFPFIYMLVGLGLVLGLEQIKSQKLKKIFISFAMVLMGWYIISSLKTFPYYLSYFNEIAGGTDQGYKFVVDSNYDWGQDLKRLKKFVEENNISKIKVDYFGGGDVKYYLGDKWERFDPKSGPQKGWLAISATLLEQGRGNPVQGFGEPTDYYNWLNDYQPISRAGKSIFIYFIP
jgi:hypothetical protein